MSNKYDQWLTILTITVVGEDTFSKTRKLSYPGASVSFEQFLLFVGILNMFFSGRPSFVRFCIGSLGTRN